MKVDRIGKVVRVAPKPGPGAQAQAVSRNEVHITNIIGPTPKADVDPMATQELDIICREVDIPPPESIHATAMTDPAEADELDINPKLGRFRARQMDQVEYTVDAAFLENVIKVLIDNHNITITPHDIEAILSPFGECVVKAQLIPIQSRGVETVGGGCCSCSDEQKQEAVEVVKNVVLNGLSLVKHIPDLLGFLGKIGVSI
jgi:hypothetical protein